MVADLYDFNQHAYRRFVETLKVCRQFSFVLALFTYCRILSQILRRILWIRTAFFRRVSKESGHGSTGNQVEAIASFEQREGVL
jgi:hypothetical protein